MNDVKLEDQSESVELRDCGRASQVTKGGIFIPLFEISSPPADRVFLL